MIDSAWLLAPLAAGVLTLLSHLRLGEQVLRRGIVFIDLAIAQVAAVGVLFAEFLHLEGAAAATATAVFAIAGAILVAALSRHWPQRREASIGVLYVAAASLAILWVSADPHGSEKLSALLAGDVLWTTEASLAPLAVATALFVGCDRLTRGRWLESASFYPVFAVMVSLTLPLLGLYLVFASLIVPALCRGIDGSRSRRTVLAAGCVAWAAGIGASYAFDWPTGPTIVLSLVIMGIVVAAGGRKTAC